MPTAPNPSLDRLENAIQLREFDAAYELIAAILKAIDRGYGRIDAIAASDAARPQSADHRIRRFATRFASAFGRYIAAPAITFDDRQFGELIAQHRWIEMLFAVSGFGSVEHLLPLLVTSSTLSAREKLLRLLVILPLGALPTFDPDEFAAVDRDATLTAALHYVGNRYAFSPGAYQSRELLLEWLPGRVADAELAHMAPNMLVEPYMQCSYATTRGKHAVKADIIAQMRRRALAAGCREHLSDGTPTDKPVIAVVTEHFGEGHSVFRTHSRAVASLRDRFHVVGICFAASLSPAVEACFDEVLVYPPGELFASVRRICDLLIERQPQAVFHLGVGMAPHVIALASLRLAPVQAVSFGHTATTMSPAIDYMILPEDFVRGRDCYSETLLLVPPAAMPYAARLVERPGLAEIEVERQLPAAGAVRIGIAASVAKLNPGFFAALARIEATVASPVEFHFFPLGGVGLVRVALRDAVSHLNAVVHDELAYADYLRALAACDYFLCPFPYGNMNSIIDAFSAGVPGVCMDGDEAHAHADSAYFARAGLPLDLVANDVAAYVSAAARLADDTAWRKELRSHLLSLDLEARLLGGDSSLFAEAFASILKG